jgi:hypothetical protein
MLVTKKLKGKFLEAAVEAFLGRDFKLTLTIGNLAVKSVLYNNMDRTRKAVI